MNGDFQMGRIANHGLQIAAWAIHRSRTGLAAAILGTLLGALMGVPGCQRVSSEDGWSYVSADSYHTCALDTHGKVTCWGCERIEGGDVGEGSWRVTIPGCEGPADQDTRFTMLRTHHTVDGVGGTGITDSGGVANWGYGDCHEWRLDEQDFLIEIAQSSALTADGVILTDCGEDYRPGLHIDVGSNTSVTCGVSTDNGLDCWLNQQYEDSAGVLEIPTGTFIEVDLHDATACALSPAGEVDCWGCLPTEVNDKGQCDAPDGTYVQVSAGTYHACAIDEEGKIHCWGDDEYGQASPPGGTFTQVSAGTWHSCGLRDDGHIVCWGCGTAPLRHGHNYGQCTPP